jgi:hypothetical protein
MGQEEGDQEKVGQERLYGIGSGGNGRNNAQPQEDQSSRGFGQEGKTEEKKEGLRIRPWIIWGRGREEEEGREKILTWKDCSPDPKAAV